MPTTTRLTPATPWHIRERERAREAVQHLQEHRHSPGFPRLPYWQAVNRAEACLRDAIRAHRFARGNSAIQTFGTAGARHAVERGYVRADQLGEVVL